MKKSFILHHDTISVIEELTDEQAGQLIKAIYRFSIELNNPEEPKKPTGLSWLMGAVFHHFKIKLMQDFEKLRIGQNNWNWKGGITPENNSIRNSIEYKHWRTSVFKRDSYKCQECGCVGDKLNAHHIKKFSQYPDLRLDVSNGITLCKPCHIDKHRKK